MCTVSIIRLDGGSVRLVTSRDESPLRPAALAPAWRTLADGVRAIWPTDPLGGGTWIAANTRGLAMTLLNYNAPESIANARGANFSRGTIIPALIDSESAEHAVLRLRDLDLARYAPFRFVAFDAADPSVHEARWDTSSLRVVNHAGAPICFASSGLGDHLVEPRLDLFERMVAAPSPSSSAQDAFHDHHWPDRPEISVRMRRAEARTVSICVMELSPRQVAHDPGVRKPFQVIARYRDVSDDVVQPTIVMRVQSAAQSAHRP